MRIAVISHKVAWPTSASPAKFATNGGFALQMSALSELFEQTTLCIPIAGHERAGSIPFTGRNLVVVPLTLPRGSDLARRALLPLWLLQNVMALVHAVRKADAVHVPIPSDIGAMGIMVARLLRRPLLIRHCGNWLAPATRAERIWKGWMERSAGGRDVMLATGEGIGPASARNAAIEWIFSTTLTDEDLALVRGPRTAPSGVARVAIAGRQIRVKGTGIAIEAVTRLAVSGQSVALDVIGDGPDLPDFQRLARSLRVDDRVSFLGQLSHEGVLTALRKADLFVFPTSASEGFPKAVAEALACGLPIISSDVGALPRIVGAAGLTLHEPDAADLSEAIADLLNDPVSYRQMSEHALAIASRLSLTAWRDRIHSLLEERWGLGGHRASERVKPGHREVELKP